MSVILKSLASLWQSAGAKVPESVTAPQPAQLETTIRESLSDQAAKIMIAEVADLKKAMREFLMTCEKYINFGGIIAVGAVTLGILRKETDTPALILVLAPYPLGLTFVYLIQVFTEIEMRAGYVEFLEEKVCAHTESPVLLYSKVSSPKFRSRCSTTGAMILNAFAMAFLVLHSVRETSTPAYAGKTIFEQPFLNLHHLNIALLSITGIVIGLAAWELRYASRNAYAAAAGAYKNWTPTSPGQ